MTFGTVLRATFAVGLAAAFAISGAAQDVTPGAGAPADAFPQPDRPVADIISPIWHDENERDKAGEPQQLVRLLGIKPGMTVADIGAGSGYYVVRLSPIVGASGRVIAEDVVPDYLENLRRRVRDLGLRERRHRPRRGARPEAAGAVARSCDPGPHVSRDRAALRLALQSRSRAQARRADRHCRRLRADGSSMARRLVCCAASFKPSAIARSASIG